MRARSTREPVACQTARAACLPIGKDGETFVLRDLNEAGPSIPRRTETWEEPPNVIAFQAFDRDPDRPGRDQTFLPRRVRPRGCAGKSLPRQRPPRAGRHDGGEARGGAGADRKSTRLNSSHMSN